MGRWRRASTAVRPSSLLLLGEGFHASLVSDRTLFMAFSLAGSRGYRSHDDVLKGGEGIVDRSFGSWRYVIGSGGVAGSTSVVTDGTRSSLMFRFNLGVFGR